MYITKEKQLCRCLLSHKFIQKINKHKLWDCCVANDVLPSMRYTVYSIILRLTLWNISTRKFVTYNNQTCLLIQWKFWIMMSSFIITRNVYTYGRMFIITRNVYTYGRVFIITRFSEKRPNSKTKILILQQLHVNMIYNRRSICIVSYVGSHLANMISKVDVYRIECHVRQ